MPIIVKKYDFHQFIFEYKTAGELSWYTLNIYLNCCQKHTKNVLKSYCFLLF